MACGTVILAAGLGVGLAQDLPPGEALPALRRNCLVCHGADLIVQQRLGRDGWVREIEKMVRWGAVLPESERAVVTDYLAAHFGARAATESPAAAAGPGGEIFQRKCLLCHGTDLVDQQRLTREGWEREVDKMIRWGAPVREQEKAPLVDWLASRGRR